MKRSTRGFVSGFSVALLATGAWGVFGSGGGGTMMMMERGYVEAGSGGRSGIEERFVVSGATGEEREAAREEMERARQVFREGGEEEGLERMAAAVEMVPGQVGVRIEYAAYLKERGERMFLGGHGEEGAALLESASYQAQVALGRCSGDPARGREIAACYVILGDLSFEAGRDVRGAAELYRNALDADGLNAVAKERLADAHLVLDQRGERRVTRMVLR